MWVALKDAAQAELAEVQHEFGLQELAVEDARVGYQRPKIEECGDSLFVVLHTVELTDGELHIGEVDVFVGANYVLSNRTHCRQGSGDVRVHCERETHHLKQGTAFILYALMDEIVGRYFPVVEALKAALWKITERIFASPAHLSTLE